MTFIFVLILGQAFERYSISGQAQGLAYAYTASAFAVDAIRFNPAALSLIAKNYLGSSYEYTFSHIEGLQNISIGFARPLFIGGFGLQLSEFGFSEQKEQAVTLAYGLGLSKDFKAGFSADFYVINNRRTGYGLSYGLNIGLLGRLYKKWSLGVYGHNLNRPQFGTRTEAALSPELRTGMAYKPIDGILSEIDFSLLEDNFSIHLAGEFKLFDPVSVRTGVRTYPQTLCAGMGILYRFINFDYAVEYIFDLPLSHTITANFEF